MWHVYEQYLYDIKIDPKEIIWQGVDWLHEDHNKYQWRAVVNAVMNMPVIVASFIHSRTFTQTMYCHVITTTHTCTKIHYLDGNGSSSREMGS